MDQLLKNQLHIQGFAPDGKCWVLSAERVAAHTFPRSPLTAVQRQILRRHANMTATVEGIDASAQVRASGPAEASWILVGEAQRRLDLATQITRRIRNRRRRERIARRRERWICRAIWAVTGAATLFGSALAVNL